MKGKPPVSCVDEKQAAGASVCGCITYSWMPNQPDDNVLLLIREGGCFVSCRMLLLAVL